MSRFQRSFQAKIFSLLLIALLLHGPYPLGGKDVGADMSIDEHFAAALKDYRGDLYEAAAEKLEHILPLISQEEPVLKAKVYLLLGACYEKSGKTDQAETLFMKLKKMRDNGQIDEVPAVPGVDRDSLTGYRKIFTEKAHFKFNKPVPVSDIIRNKVVQAPRKSIEQKNKEKKRKKFPWLIAVGATVIVGTALILFLTQRIKDKPLDLPEIEWVKIPAGDFLMGDNYNEGDADELPVHKVYLNEYHISKFEVTGSNYARFCNATGRDWPYNLSGGNWSRPVRVVSWQEAKDFCEWLSKETGTKVDLPTEAQWEKAARSDKQYRYPWGKDPLDEDSANYNSGAVNNVGTYWGDASPYGIYDMAGNVSEWCRDWYDASYYSISPVENPMGPGAGSARVIRGGNYESGIPGARAANRSFKSPYFKESGFGFRIVMEN